MTEKSAKFFEVSVRYPKLLEDGREKNVTERYILNATSFGDGEEETVRQLSHYCGGEVDIRKIQPARYCDILSAGHGKGGRYYKARVDSAARRDDGRAGRATAFVLVHAPTLPGAVQALDSALRTSLADYEIVSVADAGITDVFGRGAEGRIGDNAVGQFTDR